MSKLYAYNTSATQIKKRYAMIGSTATQVKKKYAMIGSTATLVYSAEKVLLGDGTNLLGKPTYNWAEGEGWASINDFTLQDDGSYLMRMAIGSNSWRNWTFVFPNKVTVDGYTTFKLTYTVTDVSNISSWSVYTGNATYDRLNTTKNTEYVFTKDITGRDNLKIYFGGNFGAGGRIYAKIKITLE